jgi:hypothetical protein
MREKERERRRWVHDTARAVRAGVAAGNGGDGSVQLINELLEQLREIEERTSN